MEWVEKHQELLNILLQLVINFLVTLCCIMVYHMVYHQKQISKGKPRKKRVTFKTEKPEYHRSVSGKSKFEILDEYLYDDEIVQKHQLSDSY